jgi:hypothetical protein
LEKANDHLRRETHFDGVEALVRRLTPSLKVNTLVSPQLQVVAPLLPVRDANPTGHARGGQPFPATGYRTLNARTMFFYGITGITPAMSMRVTGIGSHYLFATLDANKQYFDGAKTYKVTLPKDIPHAIFWSFTLYDNQTRSMLDTPQRYSRAGSQSYPPPRLTLTALRRCTSVPPSRLP